MYYLNNRAGADAEELVAGATSSWHTYLTAYGHIVAELFTSGATTTPYYFVGDHLESTVALGDTNGNQAENDSYDAWGLGRNANGSDYGTGCLTLHPQSKTLRRFTSQEAMDSYCLVNLNARLYDPALGRMLSADPTVPDAANGQSFNRYSYADNRPTAFADPTGLTSNDCGPQCQIVNYGSGSCLTCDQPVYYGWDAISMFLPFGGLGGVGGGAGGGFGPGNGAYMGSISGDDTENFGGSGFFIDTGLGGSVDLGGDPFTVVVTADVIWMNGYDVSGDGFLEWNGVPGSAGADEPRTLLGGAGGAGLAALVVTGACIAAEPCEMAEGALALGGVAIGAATSYFAANRSGITSPLAMAATTFFGGLGGGLSGVVGRSVTLGSVSSFSAGAIGEASGEYLQAGSVNLADVGIAGAANLGGYWLGGSAALDYGPAGQSVGWYAADSAQGFASFGDGFMSYGFQTAGVFACGAACQ
ncbi:MAG: RHS repeat-associated core domain-containing protein [Rhizomicrobium sp.]